MPSPSIYDLAVVGGGPAGLHAALKAVLLNRSVVLLDKGRKYSRLFFAPRIANVPTAQEPLKGSQLIAGGYAALARATTETDGVAMVHERTTVEAIVRDDDVFELRHGDATTRAQAVVLATGVVDRQPWFGRQERAIGPILPYANRGLVDYCLLCDGHTVKGKRVAVIGNRPPAAGVGASLRDTFGAQVTVVACRSCAPDDVAGDGADPAALHAAAEAAGLPLLDLAIQAMEGLRENRVVLVAADGTRYAFHKAFLALGWYRVNSELAVALGGATAHDGTLYTDEDCQVLREKGGEAVGRLYAIGDIRHETWNQLPSAWADAETAVIHAWAESL